MNCCTVYSRLSKHHLFSAIESDPKTALTIDLEAQRIHIAASGLTERFEIDAYKKHCLLNGLDDIDFLLSLQDQIEAYEQKRHARSAATT